MPAERVLCHDDLELVYRGIRVAGAAVEKGVGILVTLPKPRINPLKGPWAPKRKTEMTRKTFRISSLFVAGALVGGIAYYPVHAEAKHRRVHGSDCITSYSGTYYDVHISGGLGPWNKNTGPAGGVVDANGGMFVCPINDDYGFTKHEIQTLNIHGEEWDSSNPATAMACRTSWYGGSGYCGAWDSTSYSGTGQFTLSPSLVYWSSGAYADFGYVLVGIPAGGGGLRGYYIAD